MWNVRLNIANYTVCGEEQFGREKIFCTALCTVAVSAASSLSLFFSFISVQFESL